MHEQRLEGGLMNDRVVRVVDPIRGDTVRRVPGPWSEAVHRALGHARAEGLAWVPSPLGFDRQGREVLSFIAGFVPHESRADTRHPEWLWHDSVLLQVGSHLRSWHAVTARWLTQQPARCTWPWQLHAPKPHEVLCHNDIGPHNCVFEGAGGVSNAPRLVGVIDFDLCCPGPRVWDVAYAAYRFVPLMPPLSERSAEGATFHDEASPFERPELVVRLRKFLHGYLGFGDHLGFRDDTQADAARLNAELTPTRVVTMAARRIHAVAQWIDTHRGVAGKPELARHAAMYRRHARWLTWWSTQL